jgi:hypothetical protein
MGTLDTVFLLQSGSSLLVVLQQTETLPLPPVSFGNASIQTAQQAITPCPLHAEARCAFVYQSTAIRVFASHTLSMMKGDKLARLEGGEGNEGPRLMSLVVTLLRIQKSRHACLCDNLRTM